MTKAAATIFKDFVCGSGYTYYPPERVEELTPKSMSFGLSVRSAAILQDAIDNGRIVEEGHYWVVVTYFSDCSVFAKHYKVEFDPPVPTERKLVIR